MNLVDWLQVNKWEATIFNKSIGGNLSMFYEMNGVTIRDCLVSKLYYCRASWLTQVKEIYMKKNEDWWKIFENLCFEIICDKKEKARFLQCFEISRTFPPPLSHGEKRGTIQNPAKIMHLRVALIFFPLLLGLLMMICIILANYPSKSSFRRLQILLLHSMMTKRLFWALLCIILN